MGERGELHKVNDVFQVKGILLTEQRGRKYKYEIRYLIFKMSEKRHASSKEQLRESPCVHTKPDHSESLPPKGFMSSHPDEWARSEVGEEV